MNNLVWDVRPVGKKSHIFPKLVNGGLPWGTRKAGLTSKADCLLCVNMKGSFCISCNISHPDVFFHFCTWWPKRRGDALHYLGRAANRFTAYTLVPQSASQSSSQMFVFFTFHLLYFPLKSPSLLHQHLHNGLSFLHSVFIKSVLNLLHNYLPSFWPSCPILSFSIFLLLVPVCLKTIFTIGGQLETKYLVKQS